MYKKSKSKQACERWTRPKKRTLQEKVEERRVVTCIMMTTTTTAVVDVVHKTEIECVANKANKNMDIY
jgi:hypothetical protein